MAWAKKIGGMGQSHLCLEKSNICPYVSGGTTGLNFSTDIYFGN
jgi:hypothetical protein